MLFLNSIYQNFFIPENAGFDLTRRGGGQNLEPPNVERPTFRNDEISNIKITKVELFDFLIFKFIFYFDDFFNYWNTQNIYTILCDIGNFWNFDGFTNCQILKIF